MQYPDLAPRLREHGEAILRMNAALSALAATDEYWFGENGRAYTHIITPMEEIAMKARASVK
jgi:hypothetical protein